MIARCAVAENNSALPAAVQTSKNQISPDGETTAWECLMIGCNTNTSFRDSFCSSCQGPRPSERMVRNAKLARDAHAQEMKESVDNYNNFEHHLQAKTSKLLAAEKAVKELERRLVIQEAELEEKLSVQKEATKIVSKVVLCDIAQSGDSELLQELDFMDALDSFPDINKMYPFPRSGWLPATVSALSLHILNL